MGTPDYQQSPSSNGPDVQRQLVELLVDGGFLVRRDAEIALRESRKSGEALTDQLARSGRFKARQIIAIRRLQSLLNRQPANIVQLGDFLCQHGDINAQQLKRMLAIQADSGLGLGEVLISEGHLAAIPKRRDNSRGERWASSALGITLAGGYFCLLMFTASYVSLPSPVVDGTYGALVEAGKDLRYVSLGNIVSKLKNLRYTFERGHGLPAKYRLRARKYSPLVQSAADEYRLPPEMLYAMIETESSFNPNARSGSKAIGLMQLTPFGGAQVAYTLVNDLQSRPTIEQLQDPGTNINLGAAYMRMLIDQYFSDIPNDDVRMAVALAAYNWGPTKVRAVLRVEGIPDSVKDLQNMLHKHAAPAETQAYVRTITERMYTYS